MATSGRKSRSANPRRYGHASTHTRIFRRFWVKA
jgi:hypothetical protein